MHCLGQSVGPVTDGGPSRAATRVGGCVRRRILASRGIVERAQRANASLFRSSLPSSSGTLDHLAAATDRFRFGLQVLSFVIQYLKVKCFFLSGSESVVSGTFCLASCAGL